MQQELADVTAEHGEENLGRDLQELEENVAVKQMHLAHLEKQYHVMSKGQSEQKEDWELTIRKLEEGKKQIEHNKDEDMHVLLLETEKTKQSVDKFCSD
jgi:hypothetical protein